MLQLKLKYFAKEANKMKQFAKTLKQLPNKDIKRLIEIGGLIEVSDE